MDFTDPELITRFRAFETAAEALNGEYQAVADGWHRLVATATALSEYSPQAERIHDYYFDDSEGVAFPDGEAPYDDAWLELWYRYFDFSEGVLQDSPWLTQANALNEFLNSFSDAKSFFPSWDWERGVWKS